MVKEKSILEALDMLLQVDPQWRPSAAEALNSTVVRCDQPFTHIVHIKVYRGNAIVM